MACLPAPFHSLPKAIVMMKPAREVVMKGGAQQGYESSGRKDGVSGRPALQSVFRTISRTHTALNVTSIEKRGKGDRCPVEAGRRRHRGKGNRKARREMQYPIYF